MDPDRHTVDISWTNVVLGIWLIIAPFLLQYGQARHRWRRSGGVLDDILLGIVIATLAWASAASTSRIAHR